jgi:hypothetical protein
MESKEANLSGEAASSLNLDKEKECNLVWLA